MTAILARCSIGKLKMAASRKLARFRELAMWNEVGKLVAWPVEEPDAHYLQIIAGDGRIGFSWLLALARRNVIRRHFRTHSALVGSMWRNHVR